ncbi:Zinc finger protein 385B [Collichthys lucidus]|uniref:Zinc finger protein 385B n=1 Tax=Collichthys lucidus TaxID=240159 RepID=A0A4U5VXJ2_COLLU|nr:Zinc finger protein 385B [Collichthys lucidus]
MNGVRFHMLLYKALGIRGMKRPFSPSALPNTELDSRGFGAGLGTQMDAEPCCDTQDEGAVLDEQSPGGVLPSALHRLKRERKQRSYTLCEVCNIQLNSAAQAQIHYNGKSHQKRLKQISKGKMPSNTGCTPVCDGSSNPGKRSYAHIGSAHRAQWSEKHEEQRS